MGGLSIWHILILGVFVLLLFGGNRFSSMMGDVAKGLKSFKQGMSDDEDDARKRYEEKRRAEPRSIGRPEDPIDVTARSADPATPPPPKDDEAR
jgi:sec-independent protein translocase protein TatA